MEEPTVDAAAISALQDVILDVIDTMKASEVTRMPNVKTMDTQPEYGWFMRPQLLGFLLEAQLSLNLTNEVFSLAVSVLDRYTSKRIINGRHHQLVGAVCVWIAGKFLDNKNRAPTVRDIEYLCAGAFTPTIICEMELHILASLEWEISAPTAVEFVDLTIGQLFADQVLSYSDPAIYCSLAKHICECALFKRELLMYLPSVVASTAAEVACVIVDVFCGVDRQFAPIAGSDRQLFDELASLIVTPPCQMDIRASAYEPYNVVSLLARFVDMGREELLPPGAPEWEDEQTSPYSTSSEWGYTSPATVVSVDNSPYEPNFPSMPELGHLDKGSGGHVATPNQLHSYF